jgi:D-serine deaminase-like pyridoxal phosphate-dependent protein
VFEPSLFVDATVISANAAGMATIDAGLKALSPDAGLPVVTSAPGCLDRFMGDEHGAVVSEGGALPALGERVILQPGHCDPTVNLHDACHVCDGDMIVDIWPVTARGRST